MIFALKETLPGALRPYKFISLTFTFSFVIALTCVTSETQAITASAFIVDDGENPSYDSDGFWLGYLANAAGNLWEDYLPDGGDYDVDFRWSSSEFEDMDPGTLAFWSYDVAGNNNIYVNTNKNWWFDPTPTDHSEFDFSTQSRFLSSDTGQMEYTSGQWLYRDVDAGEQSLWFNGNVPTLLETGYRGVAVNSSMNNLNDLLSTLIHEMGHELGVNDSGGDWAPEANWVNGNSMEIVENSAEGHLASRSSLMCDGCGMKGNRRLPSAIDIMAAAVDEGFSNIDLPRKDFYKANADWNSAANWLGGRVPDAEDDVFLRNGGHSWLSASGVAMELSISDGSSLDTSDFDLHVTGSTTIQSGFFDLIKSRLKVDSGDEFSTYLLAVSGGVLEMAGGTAAVGQGGVQMNNTSSQIVGHGLITSPTLVNNGIIRAAGGDLTFDSVLTASLGGPNGSGQIEAIDGDVIMKAVFTADNEGIIRVGQGRAFDHLTTWTQGANGNLYLAGGNLSGAILAGGKATVRGSVDVSGLGIIAAPVAFQSSAKVTLAPQARLRLANETIYNGGDFSGQGVLVQRGDAEVTNHTHLDVDIYDWDGDSTPSTTTVNVGKQFVIDSRRIEDPAVGGGFDGVVNVEGGSLAVQTHNMIPSPSGGVTRVPTPWRMAGVMNLSQVGSTTPHVTGSRMIVGDTGLLAAARINALSGRSVIETDVTFEHTAQVDVSSGADLRLYGDTVFGGGDYDGQGTLGIWNDAIVTANTTIGVRTFDMDGPGVASTTIDPNATLIVDSMRINSGDANNFDGTLNVNGGKFDVRTHNFVQVLGQPPIRKSLTWRMAGELNLHQTNGVEARLAGSPMIVGEPDVNLPAAIVNVNGSAEIDSLLTTFEQNSRLMLDLGGVGSSQYDRLTSLGQIALGGMLDVSLLGGFSPAAGDAFEVVRGLDGLSGTFDGLSLPTLDPGLLWKVDYSAESLVLSVAAGVPEPATLVPAIFLLTTGVTSSRRINNARKPSR